MTKLPKQIKTLDDLFRRNDLIEIANTLVENQGKIKHALLIILDTQNEVHLTGTNIVDKVALHLLEDARLSILDQRYGIEEE